MATTVGTETRLIDMLNDLIALDYDAIDAYQAAITRLDNASDRARMTEMLGDHQRHTENLSAIVRELGGTPSRSSDMKSLLTKGKVVLADLMGDKAVLQAMKTNEDDTNTAYDRAAHRDDAPVHVREILRRNLEDERRHRAWIESRIAQM